MRGASIILTFCILVFFHSVKSTNRERDIENMIRKSFRDPINFGNVTVGPGEGVLRVNQILNNMIVTGLAKAQVTKVDVNLEAGTVLLSYEADRLTVNVDYELDGYCLFLPIWGTGKGIVIMDDVRVTANATVENVDDKFQITGMKITFDLSNGSFNLSSLFDEHPSGFWTNLFVSSFNADAKYVFNEILPPYIPVSEAVLSKVLQRVLEKV